MADQPAVRRSIYDVSVLVHPGMPIYPGDPAVEMAPLLSIAQGDLANVTSLRFGTHTGTHLDAPRHVVEGGRPLADVALDLLIGPALVVELDVAEVIREQDLAGVRWNGVERVLFKTRNSRLWNGDFSADFVYLAADAARFLARHTGVRLVGIDYLSIEKYGAKSLPAHAELLFRDIVVLEGLDLSQVTPGEYELICLPLKLASEDGAPVRAILRAID